MAKLKFVGLTVACLFVVACANSGSNTAANSAQSSGSEQQVAENTNGQNVSMSGGPGQMEEAEYEDSFADAE